MAEAEVVTFYNWLGNDHTGRSYPSNQVILISGGNSVIASDGSKVRQPVVEVRFHNGRADVSNPEAIEKLRKMIQESAMRGQPSSLSESVEEFYSHTLTAEQKARRANMVTQQVTGENFELREENARLRKMLEDKGGKSGRAA